MHMTCKVSMRTLHSMEHSTAVLGLHIQAEIYLAWLDNQKVTQTDVFLVEVVSQHWSRRCCHWCRCLDGWMQQRCYSSHVINYQPNCAATCTGRCWASCIPWGWWRIDCFSPNIHPMTWQLFILQFCFIIPIIINIISTSNFTHKHPEFPFPLSNYPLWCKCARWQVSLNLYW